MKKEATGHVAHVLPLRVYLSVTATLLVLTAITVYVSTLDFGGYNLVIAMLIAAAKASLVALFFMHLRYDNKLYMVIFVAAVTFLAIFIILTMFDTLERDDIYEIRAQPIERQAVIYRSDTSSQQSAGHSDTAQPPADTTQSKSATEH
jgi:cytochrome c oxidase subunit 4